MNTDPESKPAPRCSNCGRPLSPESPGGFCAICMLQGALALGATPESPTAAEPAGVDEVGDVGVSSGAVGKPQSPPRFGDYELLEELGRGGMGVVYRARQHSLDRLVALKTILFGPLATPDQIRRFRAEASAAAALQHPNIVAVHEVGVHQNQHYLVMDLVDGPNLGRLVRDKPLPAKQAATYLKAVAEAIDFAHERGILHRDLKPSNVLVGSDDRPRVADFGLARRIGTDSSLTLTGQMLGSPNYMPPEQAAGGGGKVGRPADVVRQLREISGNWGWPGPTLLAHVGLGDATNATLLVQWPSGIVQEFENVAADQTLKIVEHEYYAPTNPAPALTLVGASSNGLELKIQEPAAGARYALEGSTDLQNWAMLLSRKSVGETQDYTDKQATNGTARFYRVIVP